VWKNIFLSMEGCGDDFFTLRKYMSLHIVLLDPAEGDSHSVVPVGPFFLDSGFARLQGCYRLLCTYHV
jgi:hypothetical protein